VDLGICGGKRRIASVPLSQPNRDVTCQKPQNIQSFLLQNSKAWVLENGFSIQAGGWDLMGKVSIASNSHYYNNQHFFLNYFFCLVNSCNCIEFFDHEKISNHPDSYWPCIFLFF